MPSTTTDAQLVTDHLAGDRAALATIYDRYGATLYDTAAAMTRNRDDASDITQDVFVVAAERLGQLRDRSRLKPWLFAILRNEVYRRSRNRERVVPTDFTEPTAEMTLPSRPADDASDLQYRELAELVRGAAFGLDERDQLVLEYSVRQGLQGDDLAAALGVSAQQSYGLVHRMRQRTERSLGAYCVARRGRNDCAELAEILRGWDGEFSVLIRKRVARHIDGCETCERSRRKLAPLALFGAAPALAAPAGLRDRVLGAAGRGSTRPIYTFDAPGGFPAAIGFARRFGLWFVVAIVALLFLGGTAAYVLASDDEQLRNLDASATTTHSAASTPGGSGTDDDPVPLGAAPSATTDASTSTSTSTTSTSTTSPDAATTAAPIVVTLPPTTTITRATTTTTTTTTAIATTPPGNAGDPTTSIVAIAPVTTSTVPAPATTATSVATASVTTTTTTPTVPPGALAMSSRSIDFGTALDRASLTLVNIGGRSVDWTSTMGPAGFRSAVSAYSVSPMSGTLGPGQSATVDVVLDRTWPTEGPIATTRLTFVATGTTAAVDLDATIGRPPVIRAVEPPASICARSGTGAPNPLVASATVTDESAPLVVRFTATGPDGSTAGATLSERRGLWSGALVTDLDGDGQPDDGRWTWVIEARDPIGTTSRVTGETVIVPTFC